MGTYRTAIYRKLFLGVQDEDCAAIINFASFAGRLAGPLVTQQILKSKYFSGISQRYAVIIENSEITKGAFMPFETINYILKNHLLAVVIGGIILVSIKHGIKSYVELERAKLAAPKKISYTALTETGRSTLTVETSQSISFQTLKAVIESVHHQQDMKTTSSPKLETALIPNYKPSKL